MCRLIDGKHALPFFFGQSLSSEVILENGRLPEGVAITYKSICKNGVEGTGENGRKCSNISIGDEVHKLTVQR